MTDNKYFKIILSLILVLFLVFGLVIYRLNSQKSASKLFLQGMKLYGEEKYQDAYYNFSQIKKISSYYNLSLLKQFQCADKLKDEKTALLKLDSLSKTTKDDLIRPYVLYSELVYNFNSGKYSKNKLISKFQYIQKEYPDSDFAKASSYYIAKLEKDKNPTFAKENFIEYLKYAPLGKHSLSACDEVIGLSVYLSKEDKKIIAQSLLKNSKNNEVLNLLKDCDFSDVWLDISKAQRALGNYNFEYETLQKGINLKKTIIDEKEISSAIERYIYLSKQNRRQLLTYMVNTYKDVYCTPILIYKLAEINKSLAAYELYEYITKKYPSSYFAQNSTWEVFWYNYSLKRFKKALEIAQNYINLYPYGDDIARIKYWRAKALLKQKQKTKAKEGFYDVINNYPLSYYAFLSARQLKISKANRIFIKKEIQKYNIDNVIKKHIPQDKNLLTLLKYNDFETIEELKINDEYIKSWILNKKELYPESIKSAKDKIEEEKEINFSSYKLKLAYPVVYEDIINNYTKQNDISPYLFLSVIREESHFNKNAKSPAGALGLCQIMPSTANYIEKKQINKDMLFDENENIKIGTKYFKYLIDYFKGNIYLAILSYNAGHGNISKWLSNPEIARNEVDEFVENIPFSETKNYIKKILSSYWVYLNIYSNKNI